MRPAKAFAIVGRDDNSFCVAFGRSQAWDLFFQYPLRDAKGHRCPMFEAIDAYEAIGYRCVECDLIPVTSPEGTADADA